VGSLIDRVKEEIIPLGMASCCGSTESCSCARLARSCWTGYLEGDVDVEALGCYNYSISQEVLSGDPGTTIIKANLSTYPTKEKGMFQNRGRAIRSESSFDHNDQRNDKVC
jgi:hypothetical protein